MLSRSRKIAITNLVVKFIKKCFLRPRFIYLSIILLYEKKKNMVTYIFYIHLLLYYHSSKYHIFFSQREKFETLHTRAISRASVIFPRYWFRSHTHSINKFPRLPYLKNRAINLSSLLSLAARRLTTLVFSESFTSSTLSRASWLAGWLADRMVSFPSKPARALHVKETFAQEPCIRYSGTRLAPGLSIIELPGNNRNYHNRPT